ncbi:MULTISPECIES: FAD-dependent oxidoreductase [unclassified Streptomyces]|uniref:FAD-dependent oxidoreductase n=1 Tax=unclassified Streptomyces TaxID=2593676 RepID=UPI0037988C0A
MAGTGITAASGALAPSRASAAEAATDTGFNTVTIKPDDIRYPELISGMNQRWVSSPDYIRVVSTTAQVVTAVQDAYNAGKRISVQGGGHCYTDFVHNPAVKAVINMTEMSKIYFDKAHNAFAVEAGATLTEVYETLFKVYGVTLPGGMCFSVGVGGHVSGGGYGLLSRKLGLIVDHLYAVEVVTVGSDGVARAQIATREANDPNRELWWAHTGGGGGNFGVITRYWFRSQGATGTNPSALLPKPPKTMLVNAVAIPWSQLDKAGFTRLIKNYGAWHEQNNSASSPNNALCSFMLANHKANGNIGLLTVVDGTVANAEKLLQDYLAALTDGVEASVQPVNEPIGEHAAMPDLYHPTRIPWFTAVRLLGTSNPTLTNPTLRGEYKSGYMKKNFTDAQVSSMYTHLTRADYANTQALMVLLSYGGQINTVASDATASAQRDSAFKVLFETFWSDSAEDAQHIGWCRDIYTEVFSATGGYPVPSAQTDGCYINYPDTDIIDPQVNKSGVPWSTLYYKGNYPRLQRAKAKYDPKNVFRNSQSIQLPS